MTLTTINLAALGDTINLTTEVTGTLPTANGGTNSTATTFVNAASNVTGTLATGNGGTGSTATAFVNAASNVTGTLPAANGGTGVTSYAPGKISQVIQNVITSGDTAATTTSFIATNHEVSITPSATSSNIFLMFSFQQGTQTDNRFPRWRLYRDIGGGGYSHLTNGVDGQPHEQGGTFKSNTVTQITGPCNLQFYDDPATTSACTYKVYMSLQDTTGTVNIYGQSGFYGYATAMEVLA